MNSAEITQLTARQLRAHLDNGTLSARDIVTAYLERIRQFDHLVGAFLLVDEEGALQQAEQIDERRAKGEPLGPLAGIPVAVKDVLCTKGQRTTCASRILHNFVPPYDATVVEKLRQADAILIGKTNMDEFAMGSSTENSGFQLTRNPWDLERAPGGSSGGSAAAVAACFCPLAVGSDTGGSIRQPAALCGVVGMKPTYGRVSRYGLIAFASSLDQVGPFGLDVYDTALLLEVIAGYDPMDSTSVDIGVPSYTAALEEPIGQLKIGVVREWLTDGVDPEVAKAVEEAIAVYQRLGASIVDIDLPHSKYGIPAYYIVAPAEASSNLARYDGVHYGYRATRYDDMVDMYCQTRAEGFGAEVKRRIMLGTYALSAGYYEAYYLKALKVRRVIREDFDRAFEQVDILLGPTSPTPAFRLGERVDDPLSMYLSDVYTVTANLAGIAGLSIPCGFTATGLPIGLQLLAPPFEEERLLRTARMYERETDWHTRRADLAGAVKAFEARTGTASGS